MDNKIWGRFVVHLDELVKKEGYDSITSFVNKWVMDGSTFREIWEWIILRGLEIKFVTFYSRARKFLTVPFDANDHFHYKWEAIARSKEYPNFKTMIRDYKFKLTTKEICEELNISKMYLREVLFRMAYNKPRDPINRIRKRYETHADSSGFSHRRTKEIWHKKFQDLGHSTLRGTIRGLRNQNLTFEEIAVKLGVEYMSLVYRMKRAGIRTKLYPRRKPILNGSKS